MLKEKVIKFLEENPDFLYMSTFLAKTNGGCGTVGCLAGAIVHVSNIPVVEDYDGYLYVEANNTDPYWNNIEIDKYNQFCAIPAVARKLWADEYGEEAAKKLPFYWHDWNKPFGNITPQDIIDRLNELV